MRAIFCILMMGIVFIASAQEEQDTVTTIPEVTIKAFEQNNSMATAVTRTIEYSVPGNKISLVSAFNTIAGARMEERSPGSYRINIRGSSLRAPFGVRNVKVYWAGIPITDPGGNTYFNQFAANSFSSITLFKGPASSMYGAGTGGLILANPPSSSRPGLSAEYITGSYNLQNILLDGNWGSAKNSNYISYAHNQSIGYRQQSEMKRDNFSWSNRLIFDEKHQLSAAFLYSDLYYQTPGALTLSEYKQDPQAARPAAGAFPSAIDAKAAIWQKNIIAGFTYQQQFNSYFKNSTTFYGSFSQVKNSAIRNYERRNEPYFGGRTVFSFDKKWEPQKSFQWHVGAEAQQGYYNIRVSGNKQGYPDTLQINDDVTIGNLSLFTQASYNIKDQWVYTAGVSLNKSRLVFSRLNEYPVTEQTFRYNNEVAPRFTILKKFKPELELLGTVSKGFSPPTVSEVLPSTTIVNKDLKAEQGWNYELTSRKAFLNGRLKIEATGFYFALNNALVQKRDLAGADYFANAGTVNQKGLELSGNFIHFFKHQSFLDYLTVNSGYTHSHFKYGKFEKDTINFSDHWIPGIPMNSISASTNLVLKKGIYFNANYYGASSLFLNDANTAKADPYHLLAARIGYKTGWNILLLNFYTGVDNLLNETYSLGNDINAAGGRYYNAAPKRNYYVGAAIQFKKK